MNTVVQPSGRPPVFGDWYVILWSLFNVLILVAIVVFIFLVIRYLKKKNDYKKQSIDKLDEIIFLLKSKNEN